MASSIASKMNYPPTYLYDYLKEVALNMIKDGSLRVDENFLSTVAVRIIDDYNGDITVRELCQEINSIILPGNAVTLY